MTSQPTDLAQRQQERVAGQRQATPPAAAAAAKRERPDQAGTSSRWATLNSFVDADLSTASEAEVRVWLVLFRDVRPGGIARVGMTDIARRAGLTRRGVVKAISGLKRRRAIQLAARGNINGTPNSYRVDRPTT